MEKHSPEFTKLLKFYPSKFVYISLLGTCCIILFILMSFWFIKCPNPIDKYPILSCVQDEYGIYKAYVAKPLPPKKNYYINANKKFIPIIIIDTEQEENKKEKIRFTISDTLDGRSLTEKTCIIGSTSLGEKILGGIIYCFNK